VDMMNKADSKFNLTKWPRKIFLMSTFTTVGGGRVCIVCALCVHCVCIVCALCVHCVCIVCALCAL